MTLLKKLVCSIFILLIPVLLVHASGTDTKEQLKDNYQDLQLTNKEIEEAQKSLNFSKLSALAELAESNKVNYLKVESVDFSKTKELNACMRLFDDDCFYKKIPELSSKELVGPAGSIFAPLYFAASRAQVNYVKAILERGVSPNISILSTDEKAPFGFSVSPLIKIIVLQYIHSKWELDIELIKIKRKDRTDFSNNPFELKSPKKIQEEIKSNDSNIVISAEKYFAVLELLINYGADINLPSLSNKASPTRGKKKFVSSTLFTAVFATGASDLVAYLIEKGASINFDDQYGSSKRYLTALAIEANDMATLDVLVKAGAVLQFQKRFNRFKPAINRWLYQNEFDPNEYGLLYNAIYYNDVEFVDTLLKDKTINLDFNQTRFGRKELLLHQALSRNLVMFEKLLMAGANPCYVPKGINRKNKTVYQTVEETNRNDKEKLLYALTKFDSNFNCSSNL